MPLSLKKLSLDLQIVTRMKSSHLVVRQCVDVELILEEILPPLKEIVTKLAECLKERFDIISDPFLTAITLLLDNASYKNKTPTKIYNAAMIVVERFNDLLMANGFKLECLCTLKPEIFGFG